MEKKTILIDERANGEMHYALCWYDARRNINEILEKGIFESIKHVQHCQRVNDAEVFIDAMHHETELQHVAMFSNWKIIRTKQNDFPYISFIVNLNR